MVVNNDTVITVDTRCFGQFRVGYDANADNDDVCREALVAAITSSTLPSPAKPVTPVLV